MKCNAATFFYSGSCYSTCPVFPQTAISTFSTNVTNECYECDASCYQCSGSASNCVACTSPCKTCNSKSGQCYSCLTGFYLYNSGCGSYCPRGTVINQEETECTKCSANCDICSNQNLSQCLQCTKGYYVYSDGCVKSCPKGFKPDINKITCIASSA